jgi:hypothetical protein
MIIRILWGFFLLVGIGASGYFLITTLVNYYQFQPVVQISVIQEYPTSFPAVTICNLNPFNLGNANTETYIDSLLSASNYSYINTLNSTDSISQYAGTNNTDELLTDLTDTLKRLIATDKNLTTADRLSLGFDLGYDMLLSCAYNRENCDETNFTTFYDYNYGNCFTFNVGSQVLKTSKVGSGYGLVLELAVGNPNSEIKYTSKAGIYLVVHNETRKSITIDDGEGIFIPTGFETYVSVKREFRAKLEKPYSACLKELITDSTYGTKLFGYMKDLNVTTYDQGFCYKMCYQDKVITECSCADAQYPTLRNSAYCLDGTQLTCLNKFDAKFSKANIETLCESACPLQCNTINYKITSNLCSYPTEYYTSLLSSKSDFLDNFNTNSSSINKDVKEYLLKVTVNYDDLSYLYVQEVAATTVDSLVGNIGGQFGLFIGISLISLIDLFEIIIDFLIIVWERKQNNQAIRPFL